MPLRQEDDVARLLRESGTNGASYRSFDNATVVKNDASALPIDSQITPLINEIFGKSHTVQSPAEALAQSLEPSLVNRPAPLVVKAALDRSHLRAVSPAPSGPSAASPAAVSAMQAEAAAPPARPAARARRAVAHRTSSLDDIRRVLEGDPERPASGAVSGALRGIFDRLAE